MNRILLILLVFLHTGVFGQTSEKYNSEYENFYRAEELFIKEQFSAARHEFRAFINAFEGHTDDPFYIKAQYYEAVSALEVYNNDAVALLELFNSNYPESIFRKEIYFKLGRFYYQKKSYDDALVWFNKLGGRDIEEEDREEFYFKLGYANFKEEQWEDARNAFHEVKEGTSQYAAPALYYYSHIAYQQQSYQMALSGFLKLQDDPKFSAVVPYYIAQIYYLQGQYDKVTAYADTMTVKGAIVNENDMNHLIGDAYYRTEKYDEAVHFLEKYNESTNATREENYRLGYAYFKSGAYDKAIRLFDRVKRVEDSLGQIAYYHIAEASLKLENKISARSAFEEAAFIDADPVVQEDALFNYAILSYQLDINPYDEAVEAFELYLSKYPNSDRKEDVYQYLVNVYMSTNNYQKALTSLDKLATKDVRLKTAYQFIAFNQGVERFQKANFPGAIQSFSLVEKYPIDQELVGKAIFWTADAHYRLNDLDKAIDGYTKFTRSPAVQNSNLKAEAYYNLGYAYLNKKELNLSSQAFRVYTESPGIPKQKKADAYMRVGDNFYVQKENEQAVKHYELALALKSGYEDQALFYMAKTYGYMGSIENKSKHLLDIINNYKDSRYLQNAVFELARTYNSVGQLDKALQYFKKIVFDYPASILLVDSKIYIADIYFKQGNHSLAESEFKKILEQHGEDPQVCERASRGLIEIYKDTNKPEKAEALGAQYSCANFTAAEQEDLYYLPAMKEYQDSAYEKAIPLFEKYLEKFSKGRYSNDVKNYLANAHYASGNTEKAVEIYKEILEGPNTGFTELAAARVAHFLYNAEKYDEVIKYYSRLENISSTPEVIFEAQLGLMRSHFLIENWANAVEYAEKVLSGARISNEIKLEAHYAKGLANYQLANYDQAKTSLVWVMKNTTTVKAAESRYALAEMYFKQGYLESADEEVAALLKQKPAYNYWIAKGLILRTRVKIAQDDLFQAEQTLKSVIEHYPVPDDGVLEEANELWNELMQLKEEPMRSSEESNPIIEINDNEGEN